MALSRWQSATGQPFRTESAARKQLEMLQRRNPRRKFKVTRGRGPRGGTAYEVMVYLTSTEYKRESKGFI